MIWIHKKTGKRYRLLARATDCTNSRDGLAVAVYCRDDDEKHDVYVRDYVEFYDKFEEVSE